MWKQQAEGQKVRAGRVGAGGEGLWASPVCSRGRCRLQAPQALDLEGGDFQDRRTQKFRPAGKSMMMTAAGSSRADAMAPELRRRPPARRRCPPRLGHQGARGARAAPCSAPREGQHDGGRELLSPLYNAVRALCTQNPCLQAEDPSEPEDQGTGAGMSSWAFCGETPRARN